MNKILILTTKGCEACNIAKENVDNAILQVYTEITREVKDWHDVDKKLINTEKIKDFPTVLYYVDDKIVRKAVGTYPTSVYLRWIDMFFKK